MSISLCKSLEKSRPFFSFLLLFLKICAKIFLLMHHDTMCKCMTAHIYRACPAEKQGIYNRHRRGRGDSSRDVYDRLQRRKGCVRSLGKKRKGHLSRHLYVGHRLRRGPSRGKPDGVFVGHCHAINTVIARGRICCVYGFKTGQCDYHNPYQLGGTLVALEDESFDVVHVPALVRCFCFSGESKIFSNFFA